MGEENISPETEIREQATKKEMQLDVKQIGIYTRNEEERSNEDYESSDKEGIVTFVGCKCNPCCLSVLMGHDRLSW